MKKIAAILLTAVFVLGLASYALAADVTFSGDYRIRGIYKDNYDLFTSDTPMNSKDAADNYMNDTQKFYDQRLRLGATAKVGEVSVVTRVTVSEGVLGNTGKDTYGNVIMDDDDLAYAIVPALGGTFTVGRQHSSWGNKFVTWETGTDRLKYTAKAGDITWGLFTDKVTENNAVSNTITRDKDDYGVLVLIPAGDWKVNILLVHYIDRNTVNPVGGEVEDVTGQLFDVAFNGKAGNVSIAGEFAYKAGDKFADSEENQPMGFFVAGDIPMDPVNLHVAFAYAANNFTANKYFTPTYYFGTSQAGAVADFGADDDNTAMALVVAVASNLSDAMTVGGTFCYAILSEENTTTGAADVTAMELDGNFTYKVSEGTTYKASLGYMTVDVDVDGWDSDAVVGMNHRLEIAF